MNIFAYDLAGQLDSITRYASTGTTGAVAYSDYTFDAAGRVTQIDHHQGSSGSGDRIDGYDLVWARKRWQPPKMGRLGSHGDKSVLPALRSLPLFWLLTFNS